jgi:hypothetical protein
MRYKGNFVIPIILDCSESELFNSVIICCTTIDALSMSSESNCLQLDPRLTDLFPVAVCFSKSWGLSDLLLNPGVDLVASFVPSCLEESL